MDQRVGSPRRNVWSCQSDESEQWDLGANVVCLEGERTRRFRSSLHSEKAASTSGETARNGFSILEDTAGEVDSRRDVLLFKHERWSIFPTEKEKSSVLAALSPLFEFANTVKSDIKTSELWRYYGVHHAHSKSQRSISNA